MNRLESMRAAQGRATARSPTAAVAEPPKAPTVVVHQCGHERPIAEVEGTHFENCRETARRRKAEKHRARQANKPERLDARHGRLPDRARFSLNYDETAQRWDGTLEIEGCSMFGASASGVFQLLRELDRKYRQNMAANVCGTQHPVEKP